VSNNNEYNNPAQRKKSYQPQSKISSSSSKSYLVYTHHREHNGYKWSFKNSD